MTTNFSWKSHPQVLEAVLQYVEDHVFSKATAQDYTSMAQYIQDATQMTALPSTIAIQTKLCRVVGEKANGNYKLADLWKHGARILDLHDLNCSITLNENRLMPKPASVKTANKRTAAETDDDEQLPSKRLRINTTSVESATAPYIGQAKQQPHQADTLDESIARTSTRRSHDDTEITESSAEPPRKYAQPIPKDNQVNESSIDLTETSTDSTLSSLNTVTEVPVANKTYDTTNNSVPQQPARNGKYWTQNAPVNQALTNHIRQAFANRIDSSSEGSNNESDSETDDDSSQEDEPQICDDAKTRFYRPSIPQQNPHDPKSIQDTMHRLSWEIYRTVDWELRRRGVDGRSLFHLDENSFDADFTKILQFIFGPNLSLYDIKEHLRRRQGTRRLELHTLLESLIAASITTHILEVPPQGRIRNESAEFKYLDFVLDYSVEQNAKTTGVQYGKKEFKEFLHQYAVRNHILRDIMPQNDDKAATLALKMENQILAMFPAPHPEFYTSFAKGSTSCSHYIVARKEYQVGEGLSPVCDAFSGTETESELYKDLKAIYKLALDERAKWEAEGEAKYEFRWPRYGQEFQFGYDHTEEPIDTEQPHRVFVATLPGVWAQRRHHREAPWRKPECITTAYVYLLDPKYKEQFAGQISVQST